MVTTRGGIETPGSAATPMSSKGKVGKRELESIDTPTQAKRQRKTAPVTRKKVVEETPQPDDPAPESTAEESSDTIAVTIPARKTRASQISTKEGTLPVRHRSSPKVVVAKPSPPAEGDALVPTQETDYHTPDQHSGSVYATPATQKRDEGSPTPKAKATKPQTPASVKRGRGRPRKVQQDEPSTLEVTQTVTKILNDEITPTSSSKSKKAHMRFGSEEPAGTDESIIVNAQGHKRYGAPEEAPKDIAIEAAQEDDDASDSDEAPEVVTTAAATTIAKAAQAEAARALQAQQAKEQAKRQAREELIAAQQAAKREREEKKAKKLAKQQAKLQKLSTVSDGEEEETTPTTAIPLNGLLPDSLLATIDDQRPPTPPPSRRGKTDEELRREKLNHHIKFLERTDKPAKDVKKGKLSVAVLAQQNRVLPPKVNRDTKNVREHWLKGRKAEKKKGGRSNIKFGKMERRSVGSGFLRGDD